MLVRLATRVPAEAAAERLVAKARERRRPADGHNTAAIVVQYGVTPRGLLSTPIKLGGSILLIGALTADRRADRAAFAGTAGLWWLGRQRCHSHRSATGDDPKSGGRAIPPRRHRRGGLGRFSAHYGQLDIGGRNPRGADTRRNG